MDDVQPTQEIIDMVEESRKQGGRHPRPVLPEPPSEKVETKKSLNEAYGKFPTGPTAAG
jgi:hypothetical protein